MFAMEVKPFPTLDAWIVSRFWDTFGPSLLGSCEEDGCIDKRGVLNFVAGGNLCQGKIKESGSNQGSISCHTEMRGGGEAKARVGAAS
jgi:hypothetical protein